MGGALRRLRQMLPEQDRGRRHRRGGADPGGLPAVRRYHLPLRPIRYPAPVRARMHHPFGEEYRPQPLLAARNLCLQAFASGQAALRLAPADFRHAAKRARGRRVGPGRHRARIRSRRGRLGRPSDRGARRMNFASDNCGPVHPEVLAALNDANHGHAPAYGADALMDAVRDRLRDLFEAPEAEIFLVATGTAANALALSTLTQPWQTVFCTPLAHIQTDECNAPEFYTGGAKLSLAGEGDKMTPEALNAAIESWPLGDVHVAQRGPVALTQATERGRVYTTAELAALTEAAHAHVQPVYMDGARFANALEALGCTPAEMTWKAGIDALSLGATKNGCLGVEAVMFFAPDTAWEFELRRKRAAHLFSK